MLPKNKAKSLPQNPGVYIFKNSKGDVLYVGKAKSLRTRVQSYFRAKANLEPNKKKMVTLVTDIEAITCDTENEALILEANLIHKHQPPYNIILRDDKYYLFIKITTNETTPRIFPVRKLKKDNARYFGPYSSASSVRQTLKLLRRIFPYKGERETYQDKIFPHPLFDQGEKNAKRSSENKIQLNANTYNNNIQKIISFLQGNRQQIINTLTTGMKKASSEKQYERAAIFRDQLSAIERLEGSQKVYLTRDESFDIISIARQNRASAANVFSIRHGKLLTKNTFLLRHRISSNPSNILRHFMLQYYKVAQDIPNLILTPHKLKDQVTIANQINNKKPPVIQTPQRGKKKNLLKMGELNAQQLLIQEADTLNDDVIVLKSLTELSKALFVKANTNKNHSILSRIETYDISNIQGKLATGSMVVFSDGKPNKKQYKKFKINLTNTPNDYAMLQEVLARRFAHKHKDWPKPDLILIDGGRGQLNAAKYILNKQEIDIPIAAVAKREETIFTYNQTSRPKSLGEDSLAKAKKEIHSTSVELAPTERAAGVTSGFGRHTIKEVQLPYDSPALFLIQRMRDEAHRFTISYHKLLRSKHQQKSLLDEIPSIGPKTKKKLLNNFGSLKAIRSANVEELIKVIGKSKVAQLQNWL